MSGYIFQLCLPERKKNVFIVVFVDFFFFVHLVFLKAAAAAEGLGNITPARAG